MKITKNKQPKNAKKTAPEAPFNGLKSRYENMRTWEKKAFIKNISDATGRHESTIYAWIRGGKPSKAEQSLIAYELGARIDELFLHLQK